MVDERPGIATTSQCYRPGSIVLVARDSGELIVVPTSCKTWRCKGCRDRMINLFKARVVIGCSTLGRCAFITLTYQADSTRLQAAGCVARDWKALWRRLPQWKHLKWLRVMEATKKGIPHHHVVMGPIPTTTRIRCWDESRIRIGAYERGREKCECLAHVFSRAWYGVTGDSFIVHATPVLGAAGAGAYMAKYLAKTFPVMDRLEALGMSRRWATSRGWPGNGRSVFYPSEDTLAKVWPTGGWALRQFRYGYLPEEERLPVTMERRGNENTLAYFSTKRVRGSAERLKGLLHA